MTKFSNRLKNTSLPERKVKDLISRVGKFKAEADSILFKYRPPPVREADQIIENLFSKFHIVVRQLKERYANRPTLDVNDEYDVQDLLRSLLAMYFDDIRPEEWTPSYAGTSTRMDFLLKREQIVIEVKKTREGLSGKNLGKELIIDRAHYKRHPDCKTLYCLVYDPEERILNPRGLEKDLSEKTEDFEMKVFIVPKRV